ncbi:hypothetical protein MKW94_000719, partial [Papaver nudicaule]|nr:hypothetical protein [Papaver nudicaule]
HLFGSLYIISRESIWLLKKLKDSYYTSPSIIKESHRILEIIEVFISEFKKSKESLDQYYLDKCVPFVEEDKMMQLVQENKEILDKFGNHIKVFQAEGVGKGSVIESILDCLGCACQIPMFDYGETNYLEVVADTMELIEETRKKLNSDRFSTLPGGSPLGKITLWRILFESSLADLHLDLISKKLDEAVKLLHSEPNEFKIPVSELSQHFDKLHAKISLLLSDGDRVLLDYVAMHRAVAEITYMLGDAFTTGGAGMKDLSHESSSPGSADKNDKEMEMVPDFPWDKHTVLDEVKVDLNDPKWLGFRSFQYGPDPDSDTEFT